MTDSSLDNGRKIFITGKQFNIIKEYIEKKNNLPVEIIKSIELNKTSLGNHPAFPPEDEKKFEYKLLLKEYEEVLSNLNIKFPSIDNYDINSIKKQLSILLTKCHELEQPVKSDLEKIVINTVKKIFQIDQNDVDLNVELVDSIKSSDIKIPLQPESADDIEFDGIEDIHGVNNDVYKRRMVNCLMTGCASSYIHTPSLYVNDIYELNPELLVIYSKIISLNEYINFIEDANSFNESKIMQGSTSDVIVKRDDKSSVNVIGVNFIALLHETIRALLDLISFNGLPKDISKMKYVLKKADFRLANNWDTRFGNALWKLIDEKIPKDYNHDIKPYLFFELIKKSYEEFNHDLQNIFANTKKGKEIISSIYDDVINQIEREGFIDDVENKRQTAEKYIEYL